MGTFWKRRNGRECGIESLAIYGSGARTWACRHIRGVKFRPKVESGHIGEVATDGITR